MVHKISFYYQDDFGTTTEMVKTIPDMDIYDNEAEAMAEAFKCFLGACGFAPETILHYMKD